jgi:hypothetical protein
VSYSWASTVTSTPSPTCSCPTRGRTAASYASVLHVIEYGRAPRLDAGDSAGWTAAIVAIVAAVIAAGSTGIAVWQAKSAKRSADIAEADLAESRKQTRAAEQAAVAAEQQVAEARRQNEITERQLRIAQEELEAGRQRYQQEQSTGVAAAATAVGQRDLVVVLADARGGPVGGARGPQPSRTDPVLLPPVRGGGRRGGGRRASSPVAAEMTAWVTVNESRPVSGIRIKNRLVRSTRVATADLPALPITRSPSQ